MDNGRVVEVPVLERITEEDPLGRPVFVLLLKVDQVLLVSLIRAINKVAIGGSPARRRRLSKVKSKLESIWNKPEKI